MAGNKSLAKNTSCCEFSIMKRIMISVTIAIMTLVSLPALYNRYLVPLIRTLSSTYVYKPK